jgi:hypothetical protein
MKAAGLYHRELYENAMFWPKKITGIYENYGLLNTEQQGLV